jgi:hypothetical protein
MQEVNGIDKRLHEGEQRLKVRSVAFLALFSGLAVLCGSGGL